MADEKTTPLELPSSETAECSALDEEPTEEVKYCYKLSHQDEFQVEQFIILKSDAEIFKPSKAHAGYDTLNPVSLYRSAEEQKI